MGKYGLIQKMKISILAVVLLCGSAGIALAAEYVSVVKDGVNIRSGPDTKSTVLFQLPAGYPLKVLARQGKWIKVSDYENDKGWIYGSLVDKSSHVIVKVKEGNVRSGPGKNYSKVGTVSRDVILKKMKTKGAWIKVYHPQLTGWVYKSLVWP